MYISSSPVYTKGPCGEEVPCTSGSRLGDPADCGVFYECSFAGDEWVLTNCTDSHRFDAENKTCVQQGEEVCASSCPAGPSTVTEGVDHQDTATQGAVVTTSSQRTSSQRTSSQPSSSQRPRYFTTFNPEEPDIETKSGQEHTSVSPTKVTPSPGVQVLHTTEVSEEKLQTTKSDHTESSSSESSVISEAPRLPVTKYITHESNITEHQLTKLSHVSVSTAQGLPVAVFSTESDNLSTQSTMSNDLGDVEEKSMEPSSTPKMTAKPSTAEAGIRDVTTAMEEKAKVTDKPDVVTTVKEELITTVKQVEETTVKEVKPTTVHIETTSTPITTTTTTTTTQAPTTEQEVTTPKPIVTSSKPTQPPYVIVTEDKIEGTTVKNGTFAGPEETPSSASAAMIAGVVAGVAVLLLVIIIAILIIRRRKRSAHRSIMRTENPNYGKPAKDYRFSRDSVLRVGPTVDISSYKPGPQTANGSPSTIERKKRAAPKPPTSSGKKRLAPVPPNPFGEDEDIYEKDSQGSVDDMELSTFTASNNVANVPANHSTASDPLLNKHRVSNGDIKQSTSSSGDEDEEQGLTSFRTSKTPDDYDKERNPFFGD